MTSTDNLQGSSSPTRAPTRVVALGWNSEFIASVELERVKLAGFDVKLVSEKASIAQLTTSPALILIRQSDQQDFISELLLLRTRFNESRICCCSQNPTLTKLIRAFLVGADAFLDSGELEKALRAASQGVVLSTRPARLLTRFLRNVGKTHVLQKLSTREIEILALLANGAPDKTIAEELHISLATVHTHVARLFKKLNIHSRASARERFFGAISGAEPSQPL